MTDRVVSKELVTEDIESLQKEIAALRAEMRESELERRLAARDEEFKRRIHSLRMASEGKTDDGEEVHEKDVARARYVALIQSVDLEAVIGFVTTVHEQGYCVVPDLIDPEMVTTLRDGLQPFFKDSAALFDAYREQSNSQTMHIQNVLAKTDVIDDVVSLPLLRAVVAGVLGPDFIFNAGVVAMAPDPGCNPQGLHRDDGFFTLIPMPHLPLIVTGAIALDDFNQGNGGTQHVPGSINWDEQRQPEPSEVRYAEMKAGSVFLWDGATLHGGGGNISGEPRRTLTVNYARGWLRTQFNQYLSVPRERVLSMTEALQEDLGYRHSGTGLGGCDTQDPLAYLTRLQEAGGDGQQASLGRERRAKSS
tara:strand:- start:20999 stop:22090 length:1092 start_codon:yes stop_codon:yes gene_type:complete